MKAQRNITTAPLMGLLFFILLYFIFAVSASPPTAEAWIQPRELDAFAKLIAHSPFSLPTLEESSPLAERYAVTGIITINGEEQVFVFDRSDKSRELLSSRPNAKNMSLVSLIREGNSPVKANIRVRGETGTISFLEGSTTPQTHTSSPAPGSPASANTAHSSISLPHLPPLPKTPSTPSRSRVIIRRPVVTPPQNP